jgi:CheY-like chemotaxis protein
MCAADKLDLTGRRILIVEDEVIIALDLAAAFERRGALVVGPATSVVEALELVAAAPRIDGAVLDIVLKDGLVFPLADVLRRRGAAYVFVTGRDDAILPPEHCAARRHEKPIDPEAVAHTLFLGPLPRPPGGVAAWPPDWTGAHGGREQG